MTVSYPSIERSSGRSSPKNVHRLIPHRWFAAILLAFGLLGMMAGTTRAEDAEDKLGNWMGLLSTVRFSDHWSIFGQGEVRLWEPA